MPNLARTVKNILSLYGTVLWRRIVGFFDLSESNITNSFTGAVFGVLTNLRFILETFLKKCSPLIA